MAIGSLNLPLWKLAEHNLYQGNELFLVVAGGLVSLSFNYAPQVEITWITIWAVWRPDAEAGVRVSTRNFLCLSLSTKISFKDINYIEIDTFKY